MFNFVRKVIIQVSEVRLRIRLLSWVRVPPLSWLQLFLLSFVRKALTQSNLRRKRWQQMGIAGSALFYAKGLRREQFRASTVAPNMAESSLFEVFLWNVTGNWLVVSQLCLGEPSFMPLFGFELACSLFLNLTQAYTRAINLQCGFLFQRKKNSVNYRKKKEKSGGIAMRISCSYKEEEFWENRTFLWHTRT